MTDARDVLSALIDREPVDADVLARLLEEPANRALLVDFVRVRAAVLADGPGETEWRPSAQGTWLTAYGSRPMAEGARPASRWLRAAAIFVLLAGGAGGGAWLERYASRERPPEPTRIVRLQPIPTP